MASAYRGDEHDPVAGDEDATRIVQLPATPPERTDNGYSYGSFPVYDATLPTPSSSNGNGREASGQAKATKKPSTRALAPDLLRGLLMLLMAMDHTALALHAWSHGTGRGNEQDGTVVQRWNFPLAYVVRTLTHLCGSGFTFLLGMGVVYLTRSRTALGWSPWRLARYFALRAAVLTLVTVLLGLVLTMGQIWFLNMVLFSLAVDYFLAGLLYLAILKTEKIMAVWLSKVLPSDSADDAEQPLLSDRISRSDVQKSPLAELVSWHLHNVFLLALSFVTIFWNVWLSETHGHCRDTTSTTARSVGTDVTMDAASESGSVFLRIWFWPVMGSGRVESVFPPLAWLSFAILGLLYGRIMVARPWSPRAVAAGTTFAGSLFVLIFVMTRVFRFGNLSEGCLRTPEQEAHPDANPYLVSVASFMYIVKYPPDVAFWSLTTAGNLFLLAGFGAIPTRISKRFTILLDLGTTALFFYLVHMFVVFIPSKILVMLFGHDTGVSDPMNPDDSKGIDNLFAYFAVWAAAMLIMWPTCRAYSRFKSTKSADSIWRFF